MLAGLAGAPVARLYIRKNGAQAGLSDLLQTTPRFDALAGPNEAAPSSCLFRGRRGDVGVAGRAETEDQQAHHDSEQDL